MPQGDPPTIGTIRIAVGRTVPSKLSFKMPGGPPTPPEDRIPGRWYLEDYLPKTDSHHAELGLYIDSWGRLEISVSILLTVLLDVDYEIARIVFQNMGIKQVIDTIAALATAELTNDSILSLTDLLERLSSLNGTRNKLVHGYWALEFIFWDYRGQTKVQASLAREVNPNDSRVSSRLGDLRNQKERARYIFPIKRIRASRLANDALAADIWGFSFMSGLERRSRSPSNIWEAHMWQLSRFFSRLNPLLHPARYHHSFRLLATLEEFRSPEQPSQE